MADFDPFASGALRSDDAAQPRPVFNSGSTGGAPKADPRPAAQTPTTEEDPFTSGALKPVEEDPFASGTLAPTDPKEFDEWVAQTGTLPSKPQYRAAWDELQKQRNAETAGGTALRLTKDVASGVGGTLKGLVVSPVKAIGEAWDNYHPIQNFKDVITTAKEQGLVKAAELAALQPLATRAPIASSFLEGASGAGRDVVGMGTDLYKGLTDKLPHYLADPGGKLDPDAAFERWYKDKLQEHAGSQSTISEDWQKALGVAQPEKPLPGITGTVNAGTSLALLGGGTKALGAAREALAAGDASAAAPTTAAGVTSAVNRGAEGESLVQDAIDNAAKPAVQSTGDRFSAAAGSVIDKTGEAVKKVASMPRKAIQAAIGRVVGRFLPEDVQGPAEGFILHDIIERVPGSGAALAALTGAEAVGGTAAKAGRLVKGIADADPAHPYGRLAAIAANPDAPEWLRSLASRPSVKALGKAADVVAGTAPSVAKNAAIAGGLNAGTALLSGDDSDKVAEALGSGMALGGTLGATAAVGARRARIFGRQKLALGDWVRAHIEGGTKPETLAKVPDAVALEAATMEKLGLADGAQNPLRVRVLDSADYKARGGGDTDAHHDTTDNTIYLNGDQLAKNGTWSTLFHEAMHPLFDSVVANHPELKANLDSVLAKHGKTLEQAKQAYAFSLVKPQLESLGLVGKRGGKDLIKDPVKVQQAIDAAIAERTDFSSRTYNNPDHWIYSEIMAEAAKDAMTGSNSIDFLENDPEAKSLASRFATQLFTGMGGDVRTSPNIKTVIPGFDNVIADPSMRRSVRNLLRAQRDFVPGISKLPEPGVAVTKDMWGKSPLAPLHDLGRGVKGNDFVVQSPSGNVLTRSAKAVKKIIQSRLQEMNKIFPNSGRPLPIGDRTEQVALRTTPSGRTERTGTVLGDGYQNAKNVGAHTKAFAKDLESAIKNGEARTGIYHQIATGDGKDRSTSLEKDAGNLQAQAKEFVPYGFTISKNGNVLVNNYDLSAFTRKVEEWSHRRGPLSLDMWNGDIEAFKNDVRQYLKNHADGLPGEANNIGAEKRNLLNAFLMGGNRSFEAANPLRSQLKGANRRGIIRSYRLDRLETLEPHEANVAKPDYGLQLKNYQPQADENKLPIQKDGTQKAWILPDGKSVPLTGWHYKWLNDNAKNLLKFGLRGAKTITDGPASKGKALDAGLGRVNLSKGKLTVEFAKGKLTPKAKDALLKTIESNLDGIINVDISLLNEKGEIVGGEEENVYRDMNKVLGMDTFSGMQPGTHAPTSDRLFNKALREDARKKSFSPENEKADYKTSGLAFKDFFSDATKGNIGKSEVPFEPLLPLEDHKKFLEEYQKHEGNFDSHIAKSIPGFFESRVKTSDALVKTLPAGSKMLDIASSEGSFGKTVTALSGGGITSVNLDPNPDMASFFKSKSEVPGAVHDASAFHKGFSDNGVDVPAFNPKEKFDAIHESMGFQFISPDRAGQIAEAKRLLAPGGIFITEQKLLTPDWSANEKLKDKDYKSKYFSGDELKKKNERVGFQQSTQESERVGMVDNMVTPASLEKVLKKNFKHVVQYWDSGNFRGYAASDDSATLDKFVSHVGDLNTPFSTRETPVPVTGGIKRAAGNDTIREASEKYMQSAGIEPAKPSGLYAPVKEDLGKEVADYYEDTPHSPDAPEVKKAYDAFRKEIVAQYKAAEATGLKIEPWTADGQPYKNSAELLADVKNNNHLWYFPTRAGYGETEVAGDFPMLEDSGIKINGESLPYNDLFRAVHDYFGHAGEGYGFGPRGEYNAFLSHSRMFSDEAKPAMATETTGVTSWTNFGRYLRDKNGSIPGPGEIGYTPLPERKYAERKAIIIPKDLLDRSLNFSPAQEKTKEFKEWFGNSKVVDKKGKPLVALHGTQRPDRIGSEFKPERATSGPMAYFTAGDKSGQTASGYAIGKRDTSLEEPSDYSSWFKFKTGSGKEVPLDRAWFRLTPAERATATKNLAEVGYENPDTGEGEIVPNSSSIAGKDHVAYLLRSNNGNALKAAKDLWLDSGALVGEEEKFLDVLKGLGVKGARFDNPDAAYPAVFPVYLKIEKPLVTSKIPAKVMKALADRAEIEPSPANSIGADPWDKNIRDPEEWVKSLKYDKEQGTAHTWTSIPDWVTDTLKSFGYDGIHDSGGKYSGIEHDVWIPFDSTQVKSATGNRGSFNPENPDITFSPKTEEKAPMFYSQLERVVDSKFSGAQMPAAQLAAVIRKPENGVKADELKWSGLDDFLRGKSRVTKQEVQDFLKSNKLQLKEVTEIGAFKKEQNHDGLWRIVDATGEDVAGESKNMTLDEADQRVAELNDSGNPVKYDDRVLPGGENYREILFQLPDTTNMGEKGNYLKSLGKDDWGVYSGGKLVARATTQASAIRKSGLDVNSIKAAAAPAPEFRSNHWDEPNVVAHTRVNDRVDSEGKSGLFAEELQSDWHQEGRKNGYDQTQRLNSIHEEQRAWQKETGKSAAEWRESHPDQVKEVSSLSLSGVPDAPYKTSWHELLFRRLVRMAAEEGKDWLGWTTGEQQAERYDLSKSVSEVQYYPSTKEFIAYDHSIEVINKKLEPNQLEDYIGKEAAAKLLATTPKPPDEYSPEAHILKGEGLEVGGEGMKGFYDKILVDYANKFGKKFGAKVEDRSIDTGSMSVKVIRKVGDNSYRCLNHDNEYTGPVFSSERAAAAWAASESSKNLIHSLEITPEMKESVLKQGVAQYSPKTEAAKKPVDKVPEKEDTAPMTTLTPPTKKELEPKNEKGWLSPAGDFYPLGGVPHELWARQALGDIGAEKQSEELYKKGWLRVTPYGIKSVISNSSGVPTSAQHRALTDLALDNKLTSWTHDNGKKSSLVWSADNQFSPKTEPIDDTVATRYAKRIGNLVEANGGLTFNVATGRDQSNPKSEQYNVSIYPDRSKIFATSGTPTVDDYKKFIQDNHDLLSKPENAVGVWKDPDSGKTYLDVSWTTPSKKLAEYAGFKYNQISAWDAKNKKELPTGGDGKPLEHLVPVGDRASALQREWELQNGDELKNALIKAASEVRDDSEEPKPR